jgi:ribosomal-protein-alanine N-acetyltransferase
MTAPRPAVPTFALYPMLAGDVSQVAAIDRLSFPQPWSERSFRYEVTQNPNAHFWVAVAGDGQRAWWRWWAPPIRQIIGYGGLWFVIDEAHINTLAVHPEWRGHGIGRALLSRLMAQAAALGGRTITLEVRVSNHIAQALYRAHAFKDVGLRPRYYSDGEDAILMTAQLH